MPKWKLPEPPEYLTEKEALELVNAQASARNHLMLETLWRSGGRAMEILNLTVEQIGEDMLILMNLKQHEEEIVYKEVYVGTDLCTRLKEFCKENKYVEHDYVFQRQMVGRSPSEDTKRLSYDSLYRIVVRSAQSLGIRKFKKVRGKYSPAWPHLFRHGCGQYILDKTGKPVLAQKQLGHSSIVTTESFYVQPSIESVKDAMKDIW